MLIRDNESGKVREYGTNKHDALGIMPDGRFLAYENLQNGDGTIGYGYSFVLEDGKTPRESDSPEALNCCTYANIGGFKENPLSLKPDGTLIVNVDDNVLLDVERVIVLGNATSISGLPFCKAFYNDLAEE